MSGVDVNSVVCVIVGLFAGKAARNNLPDDKSRIGTKKLVGQQINSIQGKWTSRALVGG